MSSHPTGLFIVRAWVEPGSEKTLRAHIRLTTDVSEGFKTEVTLVDAGGVCTAIELWLLDVLAAEHVSNEAAPHGIPEKE